MEDQRIISNKFVTIKDSFNGVPKEADFELLSTSITMDSQSSNRVLVKCLQVSIHPSQLNRMKIQSPSHDYNLMSSRLNPGEVCISHNFLFIHLIYNHILKDQLNHLKIYTPSVFKCFLIYFLHSFQSKF